MSTADAIRNELREIAAQRASLRAQDRRLEFRESYLRADLHVLEPLPDVLGAHVHAPGADRFCTKAGGRM